MDEMMFKVWDKCDRTWKPPIRSILEESVVFNNDFNAVFVEPESFESFKLVWFTGWQDLKHKALFYDDVADLIFDDGVVRFVAAFCPHYHRFVAKPLNEKKYGMEVNIIGKKFKEED